jgi:hypothetical protein
MSSSIVIGLAEHDRQDDDSSPSGPMERIGCRADDASNRWLVQRLPCSRADLGWGMRLFQQSPCVVRAMTLRYPEARDRRGRAGHVIIGGTFQAPMSRDPLESIAASERADALRRPWDQLLAVTSYWSCTSSLRPPRRSTDVRSVPHYMSYIMTCPCHFYLPRNRALRMLAGGASPVHEAAPVRSANCEAARGARRLGISRIARKGKRQGPQTSGTEGARHAGPSQTQGDPRRRNRHLPRLFTVPRR